MRWLRDGFFTRFAEVAGSLENDLRSALAVNDTQFAMYENIKRFLEVKKCCISLVLMQFIVYYKYPCRSRRSSCYF
jgi:hypothetical protein